MPRRASIARYRRERRAPLRILISSGPTREPIDAVRFLSNYSTGVMGASLAQESMRRGHIATLVTGPVETAIPAGVRVIRVERAQEMQAALQTQMPRADALIMAAAVCDFSPVRPTKGKRLRRGRLTIALKATPDIVGNLPRRRDQVIVGFALETAAAPARAAAKLRAKKLDLIVGQVMNGHGPFGRHPVHATLIRATGRSRRLGVISKPRLARAILDEIERLWYGRQGLVGSARHVRGRSG